MNDREGSAKSSGAPHRAVAWIALAFALVVPALLLAAWWRPLPGPSAAYALAGRVPWSDGSDYWSAAQHLLQQGMLDEWGSRRPMNGAFLAARLALGGDHLLAALLMQSALLALALAALVGVAANRLGMLASATLGAALLAPIAVVQCTTQSEGLGLLLAIASMAALLRACAGRGGSSSVEPRVTSLSIGMALLTVAMIARPGALLMIPALAVGAVVFAWRSGRRAAVTTATGLVAAVAIGISVNGAAKLLYADPSSLANANFAGTLLGLARGTDYYEADAWLRSQLSPWSDERERSELAYAESWTLVREQPGVLAQSLLRNLGRFVSRAWPLLAIAGIGLWRAPRSERWLWISGWCGVLLSVPIVFGDGGVRALAASWPFLLASAAAALRSRPATAPPISARELTATRPFAALGVGAAVVALAFVLLVPLVARPVGLLESLPRHGSFEVDQYPSPGTEWVDWVRSPPAFHAVLVARDAELAAVPASLRELAIVDPEELRELASIRELAEPLERAATPYLLALAYDLGQRRARLYALPANDETARALGADSWAIRIDTVPLAPRSRVSVGRFVAPVAIPPPVE